MGTLTDTYKSSIAYFPVLFSSSSLNFLLYFRSIRCSSLHCVILPSSTGCKLCLLPLSDQRTDECAPALKISPILATPTWHYSKRPTSLFQNTLNLHFTTTALSPLRHPPWRAHPSNYLLFSYFHLLPSSTSTVSLCTHLLCIPSHCDTLSSYICVNFAPLSLSPLTYFLSWTVLLYKLMSSLVNQKQNLYLWRESWAVMQISIFITQKSRWSNEWVTSPTSGDQLIYRTYTIDIFLSITLLAAQPLLPHSHRSAWACNFITLIEA